MAGGEAKTWLARPHPMDASVTQVIGPRLCGSGLSGGLYLEDADEARLIAAAPELADACAEMWRLLQAWETQSPNPEMRAAIGAIRSALAKVHGGAQ